MKVQLPLRGCRVETVQKLALMQTSLLRVSQTRHWQSSNGDIKIVSGVKEILRNFRL